MGKWTEAALRAKPFFQKGAQTLTGNDALAILKVVVLGADNNGVHPQGLPIVAIFDGYLTL